VPTRRRKLTHALAGGGSLFDLSGAGTYLALRRLPEASGEGSEWSAVGDDLRLAMGEISESEPPPRRKSGKTRTAGNGAA
jgi:hypothetical protein